MTLESRERASRRPKACICAFVTTLSDCGVSRGVRSSRVAVLALRAAKSGLPSVGAADGPDRTVTVPRVTSRAVLASDGSVVWAWAQGASSKLVDRPRETAWARGDRRGAAGRRRMGVRMTKGQQRVFRTGEGGGWLLTADPRQRAPAGRGAWGVVNGGLCMNDNYYQQT